ncbi:MAG: class I SAM-dependent methyltransferase [Promethearchaeota archaeon]|nr:MAG: class I SAM-dependent methyltransferase [Candidatus Lokiarchaeota archaeon]
MAKKKIFSEDEIQETMLGPLWARAKYGAKYPELLNDPKAQEIFKEIEYDFSQIENYLGEWRGLGLLARAKNFDLIIRNFMQDHPKTTIVNLGAGLDTTFYRVDNGYIQCYNIDLPEAVKFRKSLIPDEERNVTIAKSAFDYNWFDTIQYKKSDGIIFIAGGFVYYFTEEQVKELFIALAKRFQNGEMIFDATSKLANKIVNRRAKKAGETKVRFNFGVGNPKKVFPKWSPKIKLKNWYSMWSKITINPEWHKNTIKAIKLSEIAKAAKIIHLRFLE